MRSNFSDAAIEFGTKAGIGVISAELFQNVIVPAFGAARPANQIAIVLGGALGGGIYAAIKKFG